MDPSIFVSLALLAVSLFLLLFMAERFVGAAEELGLALGIPQFILGMSVLAVGTSLPELITGIIAVDQGSSELVVGTVVGSNIANILLILGLTAIYSKNVTIAWDLLHGDLPILFGSLLLLAFVIYPISGADLANYTAITDSVKQGDGGDLGTRSAVTFWEAVMLLLGYGLYLSYYFQRNKEETAGRKKDENRPKVRIMSLVWIVLGAIGIYFGADFTVKFTVQVATVLGLGSEIIGASIIAMGTSMPELVVAIAAIRRNNFEMAIGNVTGSNIFNTFVVLSVPGLLAPFMGDKVPLRVGMDSVLFLQIPYYGATVLLFLVVVMDKTLTRTEGFIIFLAYLLFIGKLFSMF